MRSIFQKLYVPFTWVWKFLTEPFETLPKAEDRTRAVFASAFLLFSAIAVAMEQSTAGNTPLVALILLIIGYLLARTRGFKIATLLLIVTLTFPSYLVVFRLTNLDPNRMISAFAWIVIPLLISSLVYSVRTTVIIGTLNILALIVLPHIRPELNYGILGGALGFYGLSAAILIIVMTQRNQIEKDRKRELIESHNELKQEANQREMFAKQAQRRADQLVMLNEVSHAISSEQSVEKVLELIFEKTRQVIPLDVFYVALYDRTTDSISFPIMFDNGQRWKNQTASFKNANRIADIFQSGNPLLLNRTSEEIEESRKVDTRLGDQSRVSASAVTAPLQLGSRIIGVISAQSYSMDTYNDDHLVTLTALAHQVVVAIENVRLFEQTSKRAQRLAILNEIGREISTLTDLPSLMENVYQQVSNVLPTDVFFIGMYDKNRNELVFPIMYDAGRRRVQQSNLLLDGTLSGKTILTRKALRINNWPESAEENIIHHSVGDDASIIKSAMFAPMLSGKETLGVISVQSHTADAYHEEDLDLLSGIAFQVAIAIQNTRLLDDIKQNEGHLSILNEVGRVVSELRDLPELLELIHEQVNNYLSADFFYVGLYTPETDSVFYPFVIDEGIRYYPDPEPLTPNSFLSNILNGEPATFILRSSEELRVNADGEGMLGNETKRSASLLAAPLKISEKAIGVISTQSYSINAYTKDDLNLLIGIGNQVSIAIENSRLYTAIQQEIKERERAEMESQRERDFAVQIMDTLGQGVSVSMLDGVYEYVNPAYAQMLGYNPEDMIGEPSDRFALPDEAKKYKEERRLRQTGKATTYETHLKHKDGQTVHVLVTGVPRYTDGRITGSIAAITDLTERIQTELEREKLISELEIKNAELERFTYTVSHDLKSPIVTIGGFLGFLENDLQKENYEKIPHTISRIRKAAIKMEQLLNELLELSRIGRLVNPPKEVPFKELISETLELADGQLRENQVEVKVEAEFPVVYVDRIRIVEVLQNLITNAAKFMGDQKNPTIEIGVKVIEGDNVFFIKDNGIGIAPEFHDRIFGLFNKLDQFAEGTGIGLALVKRIVEVHGGKIWVESELGKGATFYFTLANNK